MCQWDSQSSTFIAEVGPGHPVLISAVDASGDVLVGLAGEDLTEVFTVPPSGPPPNDVFTFHPPGLRALEVQGQCSAVHGIRVEIPPADAAGPVQDVLVNNIGLHYAP